MTRRFISQGSAFEAAIGYSRTVVDGAHVWVAGTTGFDYATMTIGDDIVAQCRRTLANIADALASAGATMADVVRVTYYLRAAEDFPPCFALLREAFAEAPPAATMIVVAGFADPRIRIEIEVTALKRS